MEAGILSAHAQLAGAEWLRGGVALWATGAHGSRLWVQALSLQGDVVQRASEIVGVDIADVRAQALPAVVLTGEMTDVAVVHPWLPEDEALRTRLARIREASSASVPGNPTEPR